MPDFRTMEIKYLNRFGQEQTIVVYQETIRNQVFFRIFCGGEYVIEIFKREDGIWEDLYNGPTERSNEYGGLIAGSVMNSSYPRNG